MSFWKQIAVLLVVFCIGCRSETPDLQEAMGGKFVGYTYSETPVVEVSTPVKHGHTLKFRAYDLGEEARFVVYAQRENNGEYYTGIIRVGIQDPEGNAYTFYHSAEGDPIDRPILWKRRVAGIHRVNVKFNTQLEDYSEVNFDVPLVFEPISPVLIAGVIVALVAGVVGFVLFMRKRQTAS